jgi:hypothetical protein
MSGLHSEVRVEDDFVQADLDTAFALLADAEMQTEETQSCREERAYALRAIGEAEKAIADGERRLPRLNDSDRERVRYYLERIRAVIENARRKIDHTQSGA